MGLLLEHFESNFTIRWILTLFFAFQSRKSRSNFDDWELPLWNFINDAQLLNSFWDYSEFGASATPIFGTLQFTVGVFFAHTVVAQYEFCQGFSADFSDPIPTNLQKLLWFQHDFWSIQFIFCTIFFSFFDFWSICYTWKSLDNSIKGMEGRDCYLVNLAWNWWEEMINKAEK